MVAEHYVKTYHLTTLNAEIIDLNEEMPVFDICPDIHYVVKILGFKPLSAQTNTTNLVPVYWRDESLPASLLKMNPCHNNVVSVCVLLSMCLKLVKNYTKDNAVTVVPAL